jgi:hypothetical protein
VPVLTSRVLCAPWGGVEWVTCPWDVECDVTMTSARSGLMDCGVRFFQFRPLWQAIHLTGFYTFARFWRWQCWTHGFHITRFFEQLNWLANFCFSPPPPFPTLQVQEELRRLVLYCSLRGSCIRSWLLLNTNSGICISICYRFIPFPNVRNKNCVEVCC